MLDFADLPYQFVPPKPNALVISLARTANRLFALRSKNHRLAGIDVRGAERFAAARREKGACFVLLPNHPTHSDPHVIFEVCRRLRLKPAFMTAYDVFARGKLGAWVMQHLGAFSVDREGSDRKAMKCAAEILEIGKQPLVIFPEGNVFFCNDRVTPFNEGAAYIALRAQLRVGVDAPVYAVPISLKYSFIEDARARVLADLESIADSFGTELESGAPVLDELRRISSTALARYLKQHGHAPVEGEPEAQIKPAATQIVAALERKIGLTPCAGDDLTARVRKIRGAIHGIRTDPQREVDHRAASHWADEAMLALRILGYAGGYAASNPTLDRVAETVARLREDVASKHFPPAGRREVIVELGAPLDLRDWLESFGAKARVAIDDLTHEFERAVQAGLDRANVGNDSPGAQPF